MDQMSEWMNYGEGGRELEEGEGASVCLRERPLGRRR